MRLTLIIVELNLWIDDLAIVQARCEQFLQNHGLHLEARHVPVVNHDGERFSEDLHVHELVEVCGQVRVVFEDNGHGVHGLQAQVHQLGLFVLHGEYDDKNDVVERGLLQVEQTLRAVLDYVHYEVEEALSEVRVQLELVLHHGKCTRAQSIVDHRQLIMQ